MSLVDENEFKSISLERGDVLFKQGQECKKAYLLQHGHIACFILSEDKRVIPLFTRTEAGIIGENSLFQLGEAKYTFHAVALKNSKLLEVSHIDVQNYLDEAGQWIQNILRDISSRLEKTSQALGEHKIIDNRLNAGESLEVEDIKLLLNAISYN